MNIEKYIKAGIISVIVLIGFVIVFWVMPSSIGNYQQYFVISPNEDEVRQKFMQTAEYQAFKERFPDHTTDLWLSKWDAQFSATVADPESKNILILRLNTNFNDNRIYKWAQCDVMVIKSGNRYNANDELVKPFLEITDCIKSNNQPAQ